MSFVKELQCRECAQDCPKETATRLRDLLRSSGNRYDYAVIANSVRARKDCRPGQKSRRITSCCRSTVNPRLGCIRGLPPLVKADGLADALGAKELYIEDYSVNHPTFRIRMAWSR